MREELFDMDADKIVGGTVFISESRGLIGFSTFKRCYHYSCTFEECATLVNTLMIRNTEMGEAEFDTLVREEFRSRGWI